MFSWYLLWCWTFGS